ncbi:MAG TPA: hypothetical protein VM911_07980 [Pyrinomonadaceae bacterium]|nr:hypothetical protein [Pyrinomonadaceae bacterium]
MAQVFRDRCREVARQSSGVGLLSLWRETLLDLIRTATTEHLENLWKGQTALRNLRMDALALLGCLAIILSAMLLLSYGRAHLVSPILVFGHTLDALITAGIIGNLIVFLLVKLSKLNSLRIAFWTFLAVNLLGLALGMLISRTDPQANIGSILIGYVVSFFFWFGLHWLWAQKRGQPQATV